MGRWTTARAGCLHVRRGGNAASELGRRPAMIPLTDATIRFNMAGEALADAAETRIVNRDVVDWVKPTTDEALMALIDQYRTGTDSPAQPDRFRSARKGQEVARCPRRDAMTAVATAHVPGGRVPLARERPPQRPPSRTANLEPR